MTTSDNHSLNRPYKSCPKLKAYLEKISLPEEPNKRLWKWLPNQSFKVSACYKFLMYGGITPQLGKVLWKLPIPEKCKVFNWICYHNKMLTTEVLTKKGMAGLSRCSPCYNEEDKADHIFLSCKFSSAVWAIVGRGSNINYKPDNLNEL